MFVSVLGMLFSEVNNHYFNGTMNIYIGYPSAVFSLCILKLILLDIQVESGEIWIDICIFLSGAIYGSVIFLRGIKELYSDRD